MKHTSTLKTNEGYIHFQQFKEDVVFQCKAKYADMKPRHTVTKDEDNQPTRGKITEFSSKSKFRLMHQLRNSQHHFKQFITLTYPEEFPKDGKVVKEHLNTFLTNLRQTYPVLQYIWVFEAQTRGAPHFHIILNIEIPNQQLNDKHGSYFHSKKWSKLWSKITGNNNNLKHIRHGLRIDPIHDNNPKALAAYMAKYYAKNEQKEFKDDFIDIGRFWGASRGFTVPIKQGVYKASELKWMLKLCFHYINLERSKAGYKRYSYSTEFGCSLWSFTKILNDKLANHELFSQFEKRLNNPFLGLEKPPLMYRDEYK